MDSINWELRLKSPSAAALYVHIPFCERKCHYCDFASWATRRSDPLMQAYTIATQRLVEAAASVGLLQEARTAYVGGGTPSMVGEPLSWLCQTLNRYAELRELTCEANPESLDDGLIGSLVESGVTRLSLGVQSLRNKELLRLGRIHKAQRALDAIAAASAAGLSVSADLMCGIPLQEIKTWGLTLDQMIATSVDHVSVYSLIVEEGTELARRVAAGLEAEPDDNDLAFYLTMANKALARAGFVRYEVASYAKPGHACEHNLSYWRGLPYVGVGTSAAGMLTPGAWARLCELAPQLKAVPVGPSTARVRYTIKSGRKYIAAAAGWQDLALEGELLTLEQATAEDLMLAARTSNGISPAQLRFARGVLGKKLDVCIEELLLEGYLYERSKELEATPNLGRHPEAPSGPLFAYEQHVSAAEPWLSPTDKGWLLGNELYGKLWGLAEGPVVTFLSAAGFEHGLCTWAL